MIPRIDMTVADVNSSYEDIITLFKSTMYTRIPIYENDSDNVIGILNIKDLIVGDKKDETFNIRDIMRKPFFTYEHKNTSELFKEMQLNRYSIAIVLDEYGQIAGMITTEDLLEEIVGDIWDEDEDETPEYRKISATTYSVRGDMKISDMLELFDLREDYIVSDSVSVGGFVMENLGDIPESGDSFTYKDTLSFTVISTVEQRVEQVKIVYIPEKNSKE